MKVVHYVTNIGTIWKSTTNSDYNIEIYSNQQIWKKYNKNQHEKRAENFFKCKETQIYINLQFTTLSVIPPFHNDKMLTLI